MANLEILAILAAFREPSKLAASAPNIASTTALRYRREDRALEGRSELLAAQTVADAGLRQ